MNIIKPLYLNLLALIFLVLVNRKLARRPLLGLGILVVIILVNLFITKSVTGYLYYINMLLVILIGFLYANSFTSVESFADCLINVLKIICGFTIISFIIQPFFPESLVYIEEINSVTYGNIFYYSPRQFMGFYRLQGIFWEPGILQFYMNLLIYLLLYIKGKSILSTAPVIFTVIFSFSTTGLFLLGLIIIHSALRQRKITFTTLIWIPLSIPLTYLFWVYADLNISDKLTGASSGSFVGRYYDALLGIEMFKSSPIFGIGFDLNSGVSLGEQLGANFDLLSIDEKEDRGSTNGLLDVLARGGLVLFLWLIYSFSRIRINYPCPSVLLLLILITIFTSPILLTPFFLSMIFWHHMPRFNRD